MKKASPLLLIILGLVLVFTSITGRTGILLAALFTPENIDLSKTAEETEAEKITTGIPVVDSAISAGQKGYEIGQNIREGLTN